MKKQPIKKPAALASYVQIRANYGDRNVIEYAERMPNNKLSGLPPAVLALYIKTKYPSIKSARATYPDDSMHEMTWHPKTRRVHIVSVADAELIEA